MKRREFITLLSGAAAAWPLEARAQEPRRVGVLMNGVAADPVLQSYLRAFTEQLSKLGWIEGKNLHLDYRWSAGDAALTRAYAAEMISLAPSVILSMGTSNLTALQRLSPAAPIVFIQVADPVAQGFVTNIAHPGANVTGFTDYEVTFGGRWLDLLKEMVPAITRVAVMFNPDTDPQVKFWMSSIESAGASLGVRVAAELLHDAVEIEPAVARFAQQPNGGLVLPGGAFIVAHRRIFADAAARYRVPAIYANLGSVIEGGLMEYTSEVTDEYRQAGVYVDRILKGTKAGDLPVQAPTRFRLNINLKAARELGIEVPLSILLSADEQIE
jgi:putative tryptophan/tyrosine transport system substrate-binding protein